MKTEINNNWFKAEQGWVLVNDEEILSNDYVYYLHNSGLHKPSIHKVIKPNYSEYKPYSIHFTSGFGVQEDCKKIIASTFPLDNLPLIVLEDDVEELAKRCINLKETLIIDEEERYYNPRIKEYDAYLAGYNIAKKDFKYTEEDLQNAFNAGREGFGGAIKQRIYKWNNSCEYIQSLNNREYEFEMEWVNSKGEKSCSFTNVAPYEESIKDFDARLILKIYPHPTHAAGQLKIINTIN